MRDHYCGVIASVEEEQPGVKGVPTPVSRPEPFGRWMHTCTLVIYFNSDSR